MKIWQCEHVQTFKLNDGKLVVDVSRSSQQIRMFCNRLVSMQPFGHRCQSHVERYSKEGEGGEASVADQLRKPRKFLKGSRGARIAMMHII